MELEHCCVKMGRLAERFAALRARFHAACAKLISGDGNFLGAFRLYRYSSWFLTSVFYLLGPPPSSNWFKLGVVASLFLAGVLAQRLYATLEGKDPRCIRTLAALETLGIAFLLPFTGGLKSPFVWYAVNPIAVAAAEAPLIWCSAILTEFLLLAFTLSRFWVRSRATTSYPAVFAEHSYLLLIFLLLTLGVRLLADLVKRSRYQAQLLEEQRAELERSWELLSTFYRLIEAASMRDNVAAGLELFAQYSRLLLKAEKVAILIPEESSPVQNQGRLWAAAGSPDLYPQETAADELEFVWLDLKRAPRLLTRKLETESERTFPLKAVYLPVRSSACWYGLFVAVFPEGRAEGCRRDFEFLTDFLAVAIERCRLEELNAQLLVAEEQNRIAAEIHDGVAQYLFNIACGCHLLREKWGSLSHEAVRQQLDLLAQTAQRAAQELRTSIYRLSPRRQGREVFVEGVNRYLEELGRMSGVQVNLEVAGDEEVLSPALRKAFYRIIREACGNAVRHGNCRHIGVRLDLSPKRSSLEIEDDGCGWQPEDYCNAGAQGMGIWNMKHLAASFDGELEITSQPGKGTLVRCTVPKAGPAETLREGA